MPLLSWSYWFGLQARELLPAVKIALLVVFAAAFAIGIILKMLGRKKSGSLLWAEGGKRFGSFGIWMGVFGLLLVFFTHELIYFFGARFWFVVWLIAAVSWLVMIIRHLWRVVPQQSAAFAEQARIKKWLPKSR